MVVWEDRGKNLIRVIENSHWKPVGEAFIYISPSGAVVHNLEEVLRAIGKEKEQAREIYVVFEVLRSIKISLRTYNFLAYLCVQERESLIDGFWKKCRLNTCSE